MTNRKIIIAYGILTLTVWLVFANSLVNGFVWDDLVFTAANPVYRDFDLAGILTRRANGLEYLPVRDLTYALDHLLGRGRPAVFHLSNLLFYTLTVLLVFGYARTAFRLLQPDGAEERDRRAFRVGFLTALLFAVHPIHCEVVNFITCRNALLATLFFFAAASLFLSAADRSSGTVRVTIYTGALLLFLLSVFSKASGIILPLVLLLHSCFRPRGRRREAIVPLLPFLAVAAGAGYLFTDIAAEVALIADPLRNWTLNGCISKVVAALQIMVFYPVKLLWPRDLSPAYEMTLAWSAASPAPLLTLAGLTALLLGAVRLRKTAPYLLFALCWYLLTLLPVLNFFKTTPAVADRYGFLPSFAFFFLLAAGGVQLAGRIRPAVALTLCGGLLLCWGTRSISLNRIWYSDETLWAEVIRLSPDSIRGHRNLGNVYLTRGDYGRAGSYFAKIKDEDPCYYYLQGYLAYEQGDLATARQQLVKSLGRSVSFVPALFYLALTYEQSGETDQAAELFRQAVSSRDIDGGEFKTRAAEHLQRITNAAKP